MEQQLKLYSDTIAGLKMEIITSKYDLLFGYVTAQSAVETFGNLKIKLSEYIQSFEHTRDAYMKVTNDVERYEQLESLQILFLKNISTFKDLIVEYRKDLNEEYINNAVELYSDTLLKQAEELRQLRYSYTAVN